MRNKIQKAALVLGVALFAFTACKKENINTVTDGATVDAQVTALTEQAGGDMIETNADGENPDMGVFIQNEGISEDFLVTAIDMDESPAAMGGKDDSAEMEFRRHVRGRSFIACLRKLDLSDLQIAGVKKSILAYEQCKESAVKRARAIYADLRAAYASKAERITKAFRNGDLTEDQYKAAIKDLRIAFKKELRELQLKEKLHDALKKCFGEFLRNLNSVLNDRQWKAFVACHKR